MVTAAETLLCVLFCQGQNKNIHSGRCSIGPRPGDVHKHGQHMGQQSNGSFAGYLPFTALHFQILAALSLCERYGKNFQLLG